jgi:hypothetical protein
LQFKHLRPLLGGFIGSKSKGTTIGQTARAAEEKPARRRLRTAKKEEKSTANLPKNTQPKKIQFLTAGFASLRFQQ